MDFSLVLVATGVNLKMLTRHDRCFFALAFYRQTVVELFRAMETESHQVEDLYRQACYWWEEYRSRRQENCIGG